MTYLALALGGALGAIARYSVGQWILASGIGPLVVATLCVNVFGSFAIGLCYVAFERYGIAEPLRIGVAVGFLGAFTTFSTFSLELVVDLQSGLLIRPLAYVIATVVLCIIACAGGISVAQSLID